MEEWQERQCTPTCGSALAEAYPFAYSKYSDMSTPARLKIPYTRASQKRAPPNVTGSYLIRVFRGVRSDEDGGLNFSA